MSINLYENIALSITVPVLTGILSYDIPREECVQNIHSNMDKSILYSEPIQYDAHYQKLSKIYYLPKNWDGYNASVISRTVFDNSCAFLQKIDNSIENLLSEDDIVPTPYGTIVMDFIKDENLVSVEIGEDTIGFFTEFKNDENIEVDSVAFSVNYLHEELYKALKILGNA